MQTRCKSAIVIVVVRRVRADPDRRLARPPAVRLQVKGEHLFAPADQAPVDIPRYRGVHEPDRRALLQETGIDVAAVVVGVEDPAGLVVR